MNKLYSLINYSFFIFFSLFLCSHQALSNTENEKSFQYKKRAVQFAKNLKKQNFKVKLKSDNKKTEVHYVFAGPFENPDTFSALRNHLESRGVRYINKHHAFLFYWKPRQIDQIKLQKLASLMGPYAGFLKQGSKEQKKTVYIVEWSEKHEQSNSVDAIAVDAKSKNDGLESTDTIVITPQKSSEENSFVLEKREEFDPEQSKWRGFISLRSQFFLKNGGYSLPVLSKMSYAYPSEEAHNFNLGFAFSLDFEDTDDLLIDVHNLFYAYRGKNTNLTLGSQIISLGRVFENSIISGLGRESLMFGPGYNLQDRSLDQFAIRYEYYKKKSKVDLILIPFFRPNRYSDDGESWALADKNNGAFLFAPSDSAISFGELIEQSIFDYESPKKFAFGARLTHDFETFSLGVTGIKAPSRDPYYSINPVTLALISQGLTPGEAILRSPGATVQGLYPDLTTIAVDGEKDTSLGLIRFELGYENGTPITTNEYLYKTSESIKWNFSNEFFVRQDKDTVNLMVSGRTVLTNENIVDFAEKHYLSGRYLMALSNLQSRAEVQFRYGFHEKDSYFLLKWSFTKYEPHKFSLGFEFFNGNDFTIGRHYNKFNNGFVSWKYSF